MNLYTRRWPIAPLRQWRTHRLIRTHGTRLTYETAWALIALRAGSDEFLFVQQAAREAGTATDTGIQYDDWSILTAEEQARRRRWLARHGNSPIQSLGLSDALLRRVGIGVLDWGLPDPEK